MFGREFLGSGKNVRTEPNLCLGPKICSDKTKIFKKSPKIAEKTPQSSANLGFTYLIEISEHKRE